MAIFGQAFTWECYKGYLDFETFTKNEDKFWYGIFREDQRQMLEYSTVDEYKKVWHIAEHGQYGQWSINKTGSGDLECIASHDFNKKMAEFSIERAPLLTGVAFECEVVGVGPNFKDQYNIDLVIAVATGDVAKKTTG